MWTQIRLLLEEQSDLGPYCLPVCKNRFEKFARIFSRRHIQTIFSDAGFLGILRVKMPFTTAADDILIFSYFSEKTSLDSSCELTIHMKSQDLFS